MEQHVTSDIQCILREHLRQLRCSTPACAFDKTEAALSDIRTGYLNGQPVKRLVVTLRSPGCAWTITGGGCTMCGHWAGTTRGERPLAEESVAQFRSEIAKYDLSAIRVLSLYNSGSVLNRDELGPEALETILHDIRRIPSIGKVVLETRSEYVDAARVRKLASILAPQALLSIAMGLETADDTRRELCLNKGVSTSAIAGTVSSLTGIAEVQLYVLVGLPFLTESESIEDAVAALRYAHAMGASEIHLEPLTIQRHTLIEQLSAHGLVRLPSLYTVYEVLRRVVPEIRPYVSPFMHMPLPDLIPSGCPRCTRRLRDGLLEHYNLVRDRDSLEYEYCSCIANWHRSLEETDPRPLEERVHDALYRLAGSISAC
jgi:archaeosine synthase beta-subunit